MKQVILALSAIFVFQGLTAQVVVNVCAGETIVLHLATPLNAVIQWQESADGISFTGVTGGVGDSLTLAGVQSSKFYKAEISGSECNPYFTEIRLVAVFPLPTLSIQGLNTSYCITDAPVLLNGVPSGGTFSGNSVTGTTFSPNLAGAGNHSITYSYTDTNGCSNQISQSTNIVPLPSIANAGPDIVASGLTIAMAANTPAAGTGLWSIINGSGGSFANTSSPVSNFTGTAGSVYTLVWTISNPPCTPSSDTVIVTMPSGPQLPWVSCGSPAYTMYVHPTDNAGPMSWGCVGIVAGAGDADDGASNTAIIVVACGTNTAAYVCDNLVAYGFSDWYLPSYNELECVRLASATIGGFAAGAYWSSTEGTGSFTANARYRTFPSGVSGYGSKNNTNRVRCVRKD